MHQEANATEVIFKLLADTPAVMNASFLQLFYNAGGANYSYFSVMSSILCLLLVCAAFYWPGEFQCAGRNRWSDAVYLFQEEHMETKLFSRVAFDTRSDRALLIKYDEEIEDLENYCSDDVYIFDGTVKINYH